MREDTVHTDTIRGNNLVLGENAQFGSIFFPFDKEILRMRAILLRSFYQRTSAFSEWVFPFAFFPGGQKAINKLRFLLPRFSP